VIKHTINKGEVGKATHETMAVVLQVKKAPEYEKVATKKHYLELLTLF
jgi:hypothetical protein